MKKISIKSLKMILFFIKTKTANNWADKINKYYILYIFEKKSWNNTKKRRVMACLCEWFFPDFLMLSWNDFIFLFYNRDYINLQGTFLMNNVTIKEILLKKKKRKLVKQKNYLHSTENKINLHIITRLLWR